MPCIGDGHFGPANWEFSRAEPGVLVAADVAFIPPACNSLPCSGLAVTSADPTVALIVQQSSQQCMMLG
jgi:hypothetical protein